MVRRLSYRREVVFNQPFHGYFQGMRRFSILTATFLEIVQDSGKGGCAVMASRTWAWGISLTLLAKQRGWESLFGEAIPAGSICLVLIRLGSPSGEGAVVFDDAFWGKAVGFREMAVVSLVDLAPLQMKS